MPQSKPIMWPMINTVIIIMFVAMTTKLYQLLHVKKKYPKTMKLKFTSIKW